MAAAAVSCAGLTACVDLGGFLDNFFNGGKDHTHEYVKTVVQPTCTEEGCNLFECSCGDSYKSNIIPAVGHNEITVGGKAATCSESGLSEGKKCSVCGEFTVKQQYIPALEHSYILQTVDGEQKEVCGVCGAEKVLHVHKKRGAVVTQNKSECAECNSYYKISAENGNSLYGFYDFYYTENAKEKQSLYYDMYNACRTFGLSREDVAVKTETSGGNVIVFYPLAEIDLSKYSLSADDIYAVWKVFYVETPAYYWLDNTCFFYTLNGKPSRLPLCIDKDYAHYEVRLECDNEIAAMAEECSRLLYGYTSDTEKAVAIHDFIAERTQYAYTSGGEASSEAWAHNIVGTAQKGKGVCEAYAKSYQYLCTLNGVACITVSGTGYNGSSSEGHAWNYIEIGGAWYAVDVTWDDPAGASRILYDYMGACKRDIAASHRADTPAGSGVDYLYQLPELNATKLQLNLTRNSYV